MGGETSSGGGADSQNIMNIDFISRPPPRAKSICLCMQRISLFNYNARFMIPDTERLLKTRFSRCMLYRHNAAIRTD